MKWKKMKTNRNTIDVIFTSTKSVILAPSHLRFYVGLHLLERKAEVIVKE